VTGKYAGMDRLRLEKLLLKDLKAEDELVEIEKNDT